MEFDRIKFDGELVELDHREVLAPGRKRDIADKGDNPTPAFKAAMQAFAGYVVWVHSWPTDIVERIDVRGVSIKRPDDAPRGIIVTALLKCPHARNSTSTINTPFLAEPPENYNGDRKGFLPESTVKLIDELELRATGFVDGEREQTTLALGDSANTADFDKRAAAAEVSSTRKPRQNTKQRSPAIIPGVGDVMNPDAIVELDSTAFRQLLLQVDRDVPVDAIARWTGSEHHAVSNRALMKQKALVGELSNEDVPIEPEILMKDATQPLSAEEAWIREPVRAPLDVVKDADTKGETAAAD